MAAAASPPAPRACAARTPADATRQKAREPARACAQAVGGRRVAPSAPGRGVRSARRRAGSSGSAGALTAGTTKQRDGTARASASRGPGRPGLFPLGAMQSRGPPPARPAATPPRPLRAPGIGVSGKPAPAPPARSARPASGLRLKRAPCPRRRPPAAPTGPLGPQTAARPVGWRVPAPAPPTLPRLWDLPSADVADLRRACPPGPRAGSRAPAGGHWGAVFGGCPPTSRHEAEGRPRVPTPGAALLKTRRRLSRGRPPGPAGGL